MCLLSEYPWSNITECDTTNFGLKKWFFLSDYPQILEKSLLYGKSYRYICVNAVTVCTTYIYIYVLVITPLRGMY